MLVNRGGLFGFEGLVEHGTDEGGELEVALGFACLRFDGGLRVGVFASDVGKLFLVAGFEVVVELQGFFGCVVVGDVARQFDDSFHFGMGLAFFGRVRVLARAFDALGLTGSEYLRGAVACFTPAVVVLQFFAFGRVLLEVARMADCKLGVLCLKSGDFSNSRAALTPASIHRISAGAA